MTKDELIEENKQLTLFQLKVKDAFYHSRSEGELKDCIECILKGNYVFHSKGSSDNPIT